MADRLRVEAPAPLLEFLQASLREWRRATLKERLQRGCVVVNGQVVTRHDHPLAAGDAVEIRALADAAPNARAGLVTLYFDEALLAIDKPAGLLSVLSRDRSDRHTALAMVEAALGKRERLWPVHRLDRETSGVLLFARSRPMREAVQEHWNQAEKIYLAVVEGHLAQPQGIIEEPLWEDRELDVHVGEGPGTKEALTRYRVLEAGAERSLLEVRPDTGRKHQIRAHLAWLGHPIVGDPRYGNAGRRLGLHARLLRIVHPRTRAPLVIEAPVPLELSRLLR